MRISDWSSDVCSSDLAVQQAEAGFNGFAGDVLILYGDVPLVRAATMEAMLERLYADDAPLAVVLGFRPVVPGAYGRIIAGRGGMIEKMVEYKDASEEERAVTLCNSGLMAVRRSEEHTSELQSLMRISYAVFCL